MRGCLTLRSRSWLLRRIVLAVIRAPQSRPFVGKGLSARTAPTSTPHGFSPYPAPPPLSNESWPGPLSYVLRPTHTVSYRGSLTVSLLCSKHSSGCPQPSRDPMTLSQCLRCVAPVHLWTASPPPVSCPSGATAPWSPLDTPAAHPLHTCGLSQIVSPGIWGFSPSKRNQRKPLLMGTCK